jgi:hypothetical protein
VSRNDRIEITVTLHADPPSALAILVSEDGDESTAVWLPRSQIEYSSGDEGDIITVELPEWLAEAKWLI